MTDNKVSEMFSEMASSFKGMIDVNSIIGEPVTMTDGTIIVPISRVSFGFGGGGSEFDSKKGADTNFGGGMGGGAAVKAEAFLVINNGNVRLLPMNGDNTAVSKLIDMVPGIVDKINGFIVDRKDKKASKHGEKTVDQHDNNTR